MHTPQRAGKSCFAHAVMNNISHNKGGIGRKSKNMLIETRRGAKGSKHVLRDILFYFPCCLYDFLSCPRREVQALFRAVEGNLYFRSRCDEKIIFSLERKTHLPPAMRIILIYHKIYIHIFFGYLSKFFSDKKNISLLFNLCQKNPNISLKNVLFQPKLLACEGFIHIEKRYCGY